MKNHYLLSKETMWRLFSITLIAALIAANLFKANAQVSTSYTFSTSSTLPYTYITGGTVYGGPNDDDNYYLANIGFSYNYNGVSFTTLWVDANGFITFGGASTPPTSTYYFGPPLQYNTNCISACSNDLQGDSLPTSEMRVQTIGTAPNRTCIIQWRDWGEYGASGVTHPSTTQMFNFQIRLNENNGSGSVDIVYGGFYSAAAPYNTTMQAGLSGSVLTDFNNRMSTTGWITTTAGTANSSSLSFSATLRPDSGRTYSWVIPPTPMSLDSFSTVQATSGVLQGTTDNPIIGAVVYTHGTTDPKYVSALNFNTAGTNRLADVTNAKVYYTGTTSTFSPGAIVNQFGSTITSPSGALSFTGLDTLNPGANYFWLTYSVSASAVIGDTLDATCTNITDSVNRTHTPNITSPAGNVRIILPLNGTYTINPSGGSTSTNFISFDAALAALQLNGVSGPVRMNVAAGTYTVTSSLTVNAINGASATNTITFDGINPANVTITGSLNGPLVMLNLCKYIIVRNFTVTNTYAGSCAGIYIIGSTLINYGTGCAVKKCIINLPNAGTANSAGIGMITSPTLFTFGSSVLMDSVLIDSNIINGGYYGVGIFGALSVAFNRGMKFRGNTLNDIYYYGMYIYYVQNAMDITNNNITMRTGAGYYGMYLASCTNNTGISHNWSNNNITNFYYYGMYVTTPGGISAISPVKIYNNTIVSGTTNAYNCLYLNATGYVEVYHNTLVYNFSSATATYGPMNFLSGTTAQIKNNIFLQNGTTGATTCLYLSSNPAGNSVNYNNYYNKANTNLVNRNATVYTPSTYINSAGGGDTSFNVLPSFVSTTDFHINDACSPKGVDLTSLVPLDIDGQTRSITPNIGSDEVPSVTNDLAVVSIVFPTSPTTPGLADLRIKVKNTGSTSISFFTISYRSNSSTLQSQTWAAGTLNPCDTAIVVFTGTQQINLTGVNSIIIYTANPNTTADNNRTNDTLRTTLYGPLSGTYTIGATGADFATFAAATTALQSAGVGGPVTFNVAAGTYNELVRLDGNTVTGVSPVNTITFKGASPSTTIITGSITQQAVVVFSNCRYVTFRDFTVNNTNTNNPVGIGFVGSPTSGNNNTGCAVKNCTVNIVAPPTLTNYGITFTASANGYGMTAIWADSVEVDSNTVNGAYYGITFTGGASSLYCRNNKFRYNNVNVYGYAMYITNMYNGYDVMYNTVNMQTIGTTYGNYGLYLLTTNNTSTVSTRIIGNRVSNFTTYGIYMTTPGGTVANPVQLYNNMSSSSTFSGAACMYINSTGYTEIYHNTLIHNFNTTSTTSGGLYYTGSANAWVRNNILGIEAAGTGSSTTPVYFAVSPAGNQVNYNIYYNKAGTTLVYRSGIFNASNYLASNAGGGDSSFNFVPTYVDQANNNFRITSSCAQRGADLSLYVPTDIDRETRGVPGQIGCDDYPTTTLDLMVDAVLAPAFPVSTGSQNVRVRVRNNGANTITSFGIAYKLNGGAAVILSPAWTGSLAACDTASVTFTGAQQVNILANSVNTLKVYTYSPNSSTDGNRTNDTVNATVSTPMVGTYTIGATTSDFTTFGAAITALQQRGVGGNVTMNVRTGTYTGPIVMPALTGVSASATVTFKSLANNADSVIINASSAIDPYILALSGCSYINFKYLTLNSTTTTSSQNGLNILGACTFDSITNCKITMAIQTSYGNYIVYGTGMGNSTNGLVFKNNVMSGSYYGFYLNGVSQANQFLNYVIDGNTIQNAYSYSVYTYYSSGLIFNNNTISPASTLSGHLIYFMYTDTVTINNNRFNLANNTTMYLGYYARAGVSKRSLVANNVITGFGLVTAPTINLGYQSTNIDFYHNSIHVPSTSQAAYVYNSGAVGQNFKNNIFSNSGAGSAAYFTALPTPATVVMDHNNYFTAGTTLITGASPQTTLPAWKTACNCDRNSISYRPGFTSNTNLTPNPADTAVWSLNGRGANVSNMVPADANGTLRPATLSAGVPDIGAYEVTPATLPPLTTAIPATPAAGITQTYLFGSDTVAKITWDASVTPPSGFAIRQYSGVRPPQISLSNNYMYFYTDMPAPTGFYNTLINLYYKDSWLGTVPSETDAKLAQKGSSTASWNPYTGGLSTVDSVRNILTATAFFDFGYFTGTDNNNPLPVILTDGIKAVQAGKDVVVSWNTATEMNSNRYEVERSLDGNHFGFAGTVKAAGNSNISMAYSFVDNHIINSNTTVIYYRLKMIDNDAKFEYSPVAMVVITKQPGLDAVTVYPNPFSNVVNISVHSTVNENATISVFDISGRIVHHSTVNITKGDQKLTINELSSLNNGIYFIKLSSDRINETIKIVKTN